MRSFPFDENLHRHLVRKIGAFSYLFSDSSHPLIDSRAAEKLFERASGGLSIARTDEAFDIIAGSRREIGVGVKTFIHKGVAYEKVQEFTKKASRGELNLDAESLARTIVQERTNKIEKGIRQNRLNSSGHIYHCLVRVNGGVFIHEEPYDTIDWARVVPTDRSGNQLDSFVEDSKGVRFTDGLHHYNFSKAKNVLFKKFVVPYPSENELIPVEIDRDIWNVLEEGLPTFLPSSETEYLVPAEDLVPGIDYIVLPLYSPRTKRVEAASGINQWNAGGRARKFGESYIPIPAEVHRLAPGFLPPTDERFDLYLPNSEAPVSAKVCQQGGKALMSNPNDLLCRWLYRVIDRNFSEDAHNLPPNRDPYTYQDLLQIGYDSVQVTRLPGSSAAFEISFAETGSYEEFVEEVSIQGQLDLAE